VMDMFKHVPEDLVTREAFWRHSIACGVMARILANYRREFNVERAFVSGLLHDIGRLIILMVIPDLDKKAFILAQTQERLLFQTEMQVLGFTHAAVGAALLKRWQLPEQLIYAAAFHHRPSAANKFKADVALIHIADVIVNALYASSGEIFVPPLHSDAWDVLGLPVHALGPMLTEFTQQYQEMLSIVMPDLTS
jgi:putative nucleotidyltransferase with HDIG domain